MHADPTPEPPTPVMLESAVAANSSLTDPASSAPAGEGRLTRGRGSVSGNLAGMARGEGSKAALEGSHPSITEAATKMLSGECDRFLTCREVSFHLVFMNVQGSAYG